ncbi:hypothetical protein ACFWXB_07470 [Tsukamurella tyrosinosolvens]|nr:hypothetical protein [Tsukamurella tyrosinosolvens]QRY84516.1 hypothetical protein JVY00_22395 [Tsukamurella tyrosinosolvens]
MHVRHSNASHAPGAADTRERCHEPAAWTESGSALPELTRAAGDAANTVAAAA